MPFDAKKLREEWENGQRSNSEVLLFCNGAIAEAIGVIEAVRKSMEEQEDKAAEQADADVLVPKLL